MIQLNTQNTALVIVDVQERLLKIMDPEVTKRTTQAINLATRMFKHWNNPIIVTEQYPKGLGHTTQHIAQHLGDVETIEKMTFSCCGQVDFNQQLKNSGRKSVILTGMETHVCVLQTAQDLIARGYRVYVPEDAVQSSNKQRWKSGLHLMEREGAVITNMESCIFQMLDRCDTPDFKVFSKLLKEQYR